MKVSRRHPVSSSLTSQLESLYQEMFGILPVDYTTGTIVEFDWSSFDKNFGGNCCEHYLATTKEGWILNFGGEYPTWSEDRGNSWNVYMPSTLTDPSCRTPKPTISGQEGLGEGSIVQTINGDLISMGWFPYPSNSGGDQFYAFLYDEESASWSWCYNRLTEPFYAIAMAS